MNKIITALAITTIALFGVGCGSDTTVGPQTDVTNDSVDVVDTTTNPIDTTHIDTNAIDTTNFCVVGDDVGCDPVTPVDTIDPVDPVPVDSAELDTNIYPDYYWRYCNKPENVNTVYCIDTNGDGIVNRYDDNDVGN